MRRHDSVSVGAYVSMTRAGVAVVLVVLAGLAHRGAAQPVTSPAPDGAAAAAAEDPDDVAARRAGERLAEMMMMPGRDATDAEISALQKRVEQLFKQGKVQEAQRLTAQFTEKLQQHDLGAKDQV